MTAHVAAGTVWFVSPVNPFRVTVGLIRDDGREWVGDLNPHTVEVTQTCGGFTITHLDPEETR